MKTIFAYTDGSAVVKGQYKGYGGFGVYFPDLNGKKFGISKGFENTKTGKMEVTALLYAIMAVRRIPNVHLIVYSDSEYVVKTFTENRLMRWANNNWKSYGGGDIKNQELWKKILLLILSRKDDLKLELHHIKSHQLDKAKGERRIALLKNEHVVGNAMADWLADYKRHLKKER